MKPEIFNPNQYFADLECLYYLVQTNGIDKKVADTVALSLSAFYGQDPVYPWKIYSPQTAQK